MAERRPSAWAEMIKGRWREFTREPSAFFFVIFMPLLWMAILGFAFSTPRTETVGIGWLGDAVATPLARQIHGGLLSDAHIRLEDGDVPRLDTLLKRGDILLYVDATGPQPWSYVYDPVNRDAVRARILVDDLVQQAAGRRDLVATVDRPVEVPGTRYIEFLVPGLIALSIMTSSLFGTGAVIVASRRENLLKRYLATPMQPLLYIGSHIVGRFFILAVEMAAILLGAWAMFRFHVAGNLVSLVLVAALGAAAFTALAVLCGSRTSNMAVMNGMTNLISLPMMLVAGVWFSRANFPAWISGPARFLPLTALVDALRHIALEGAGLAAVGPEMLILAVYFVGCTIGARLLFKWY